MNTSIARRRFKKACSKAAVSESLRRIFSPARPEPAKTALYPWAVRRRLERCENAAAGLFNILLKVARHV